MLELRNKLHFKYKINTYIYKMQRLQVSGAVRPPIRVVRLHRVKVDFLKRRVSLYLTFRHHASYI